MTARVPTRSSLRAACQVTVVLLLVLSWALYSGRVDTLTAQKAAEAAEARHATALLAQTCQAASYTTLRERGLLVPCRDATPGPLNADGPPPEPPVLVQDAVVSWMRNRDVVLSFDHGPEGYGVCESAPPWPNDPAVVDVLASYCGNGTGCP